MRLKRWLKYTRFLIGFAIILVAGWIIVGEQITGAQTNAVVYAPRDPVRAPVAGQVSMPEHALGVAAERGEEIATVSDPRLPGIALEYARERVAVLEIELASARDGMFLGDDENDSPHAKQRRIELESIGDERAARLDMPMRLQPIEGRINLERLRVNRAGSASLTAPVPGGPGGAGRGRRACRARRCRGPAARLRRHHRQAFVQRERLQRSAGRRRGAVPPFGPQRGASGHRAAACGIEQPATEVLMLDDGRREWLAEPCAERGVRHLTRSDNVGAGAGNINQALQFLKAKGPPDYIAVLDADFVAHRRFPARTLALFHAPDAGLVQTLQHFFNADPIQHNLGLSRSDPDEQRFVFDHMQPDRDGRGIASCCGTSWVARWQAVAAAGGFPTASITEDFMLTQALQDRGWRTVYLDEPLTEGLAPEGLGEYVTQRALLPGADAGRALKARAAGRRRAAAARPLERRRLGLQLADELSLPHRRGRLSAALLVLQHHGGGCRGPRRHQLIRGLFPVDPGGAQPALARHGGADPQRRQPARRRDPDRPRGGHGAQAPEGPPLLGYRQGRRSQPHHRAVR